MKFLLIILAALLTFIPRVSANPFVDYGRDVSHLINTFIGVQPNFMIRLALFAILFSLLYTTVKKIPLFKSSNSYGGDENKGAVITISLGLSLLVIWIFPESYIDILREIIGLSVVYVFAILVFTYLLYLSYKETDPNKPYIQFFRTMIYLYGLALFLHLSTADLGFINLGDHSFGFWLFLFAVVMLILVFISLLHFFSSIGGSSPSGKSKSGSFFSRKSSSSKPSGEWGSKLGRGLDNTLDGFDKFRNSDGWAKTKELSKKSLKKSWGWFKNKTSSLNDFIKQADKHIDSASKHLAEVMMDDQELAKEKEELAVTEKELEEVAGEVASNSGNEESGKEQAFIKQAEDNTSKVLSKIESTMTKLNDIKDKVVVDFELLMRDDYNLHKSFDELKKLVDDEINKLHKSGAYAYKKNEIKDMENAFVELEDLHKKYQKNGINREVISKIKNLKSEIEGLLYKLNNAKNNITNDLNHGGDFAVLAKKVSETIHIIDNDEKEYKELASFVNYVVKKVKEEKDFIQKFVDLEKKLNDQLKSILNK